MVHDEIPLVCISLEIYTYLTPTIQFCPIKARTFFFRISLFNGWQCCLSITVNEKFTGEVSGVVNTT